MNNANIPPEKLNELLQMAGQKLNAKPERIKQAAQNGELDKMLGSLNPQQAKQLQNLLNDRQAAERMLQTPQAQQIIRKLFGGK